MSELISASVMIISTTSGQYEVLVIFHMDMQNRRNY